MDGERTGYVETALSYSIKRKINRTAARKELYSHHMASEAARDATAIEGAESFTQVFLLEGLGDYAAIRLKRGRTAGEKRWKIDNLVLMKTPPDSKWRARSRARSMLRVHRLPPSPKSDSLASSIACSVSWARITAATGPNVSSRKSGKSAFTRIHWQMRPRREGHRYP